MSGTEHKLALPAGTILHQYQIESVLGAGGFGIVYKARHTLLDTDVAIKEYLPQHCATREGATVHPLSTADEQEFEAGISRFVDEAKQLVQFDDHASIIRCKDFFKDNGTAYLVMDLLEGKELAHILKNHTRQGVPLTEAQILSLVIPILEGLEFIHAKGVLHRDIKPANIFVRTKDQRPILIDFGAAKQNFGHTQKSENQMHTYGYAPLEQVGSEGQLGPWTDIHAVGAMIWRIVLNDNPPRVEDRTSRVLQGQPDPVIERIETVRGQYSVAFINAVIKSMAIRQRDRFQQASEFISALQGQLSIPETELDDLKTTIIPPDSLPNIHSTSGGHSPIQTAHTIGNDVTGGANPVVSGPSSLSGAPPVTTVVPEPKHKMAMWMGAIILATICLSLFFYLYSAPADEKGKPTEALLVQKLDIVYSLTTKAELDSDKNQIDLDTINALKALGNLTGANKRNVEILESGVKKRHVSIEQNMSRARERVFELTGFHKTWPSDTENALSDYLKETAAAGQYDKSEFLEGLVNLINEASALKNDAEIKGLIAQRIAI